jgi:hypothetical protein
MSTPTPLRGVSGELARLITEGSAVRSMASEHKADLWRRFGRRVEGPQRPHVRRLIALVAAAAAVGVVSFFVWRADRAPLGSDAGVATHGNPAARPPTRGPGSAGLAASTAEISPQLRIVHLGSRGDLLLSPDALVTLPPGVDASQHGAYRVLLDDGRLAATVGPRGPDEPLTVVTPELTVAVVGTRFSVSTGLGVSEVVVEEGRVRVEKDRRTVLLVAGDSIRSDDPRLTPAQAAPALPCLDQLDLIARRGCLVHESRGHGVAAENALLALGLLERNQGGGRRRALAPLREYQRRFPNGILAPEVALAIASTLALEGDQAQACAEADAFLRRFPHDRGTYERLWQLCSPK